MNTFNIGFVDNVLFVYKNGTLLIKQPFCPDTGGQQVPWTDQAQAEAWWESIKKDYDYEISDVEPPPVDKPPHEIGAQ